MTLCTHQTSVYDSSLRMWKCAQCDKLSIARIIKNTANDRIEAQIMHTMRVLQEQIVEEQEPSAMCDELWNHVQRLRKIREELK